MTWATLSAITCVGFSSNVNRRVLSIAALLLMPPGIGLVARPMRGLILQMKGTAAAPDLAEARQAVNRYRQVHGDTPESLEAYSWLARTEWQAGALQSAYEDAQQTQRLCESVLKTRQLDAEPHLPTALGAVLEVQAQVLDAKHQKTEAVALLESALRQWGSTSIAARLRKNLNLLTLTGKPAPSLKMSDWIGTRPPALSALKGKPVLLFFWADWCADCKAEAPVLARVASEFEPKGLVVIGPTKLYGIAAGGEDATPQQEKQFIERVFARYYSAIPAVAVPLDSQNFDIYGASTTPTLVLIDRRGIVRLYHPGNITEEELRRAVQAVL